MGILWKRAPVEEFEEEYKYAIAIDSGSSGSRLEIYSWLDHDVAKQAGNSTLRASLPVIQMEGKPEKYVVLQNGVTNDVESILVLLHPCICKSYFWKQTNKISGISTYADKPSQVGEHLEPLLKFALRNVPKQSQSSTPLFLMATAGMRLLSPAQQTAILSSACAYTRERTPFILPDCDAHFQVIDGRTEGMYGWIAINYLLGSFDKPELHHHGKGHST